MSINLEEIKARNKEYLDQARKVTEGNSPTTVSDIYLKQSKDNLANKIEAERQYYAEESAKNEQRRQDQLALAAQQQAAKEAARHNDEGFIPNTVEYHKDSQFKQREATAVDRAEDTAAAIAKGLGGVYKTGTTLVTAGKYGLSKVAAKTLDREFNQTLQEALDQGDQTAGVNHLNSYLDRIGSQVNKDKLQELQAIMDTPGLTNMEQYRKRMAFYRANPSIAAYEVIQSAVKSGIELYFSGGLTKAVGLGVKSGVATGVGLPGSVDHIQTIQSKGKADDSTLLNAAGVGGLYAAFGLAAKGMGGADFDSIFVRAAQGGRNTVVGGGVKGAVKTVVPEVWEETLQTGTSVVGANAELGEELTKDMGSNVAAAQAGAIGQSGSMHLFSKSGDGLVKTVNKGLEKYADKKNGTTEDNLNPEHAKFSPTRAMDTALAYKNSVDPKQREEANKIMSRTTQVTYQRMLDITAEIELASTPEARKEAEDKKAKFEAEQLGPLVAQIKTYQKANEQNSKALFSLMDDFHKNKPEAVQKHLDSTQLIENKKKELQERITTAQANTPEIKVAPRTSYSTGNTQAAQSSGKGSLSTLIQGGESGSMGYSAVNYGNNKAGTVNLASMTYGQVVANQRAGKMVAVGKYQFHKVSLPDAIKVLPWLKPNTLMTPEVQDKIFVEYYIGRKRKGMANYIRGGNTSLNTAANEFASEWASAQGTNGKGQYAGNSVSITTGSVQSHLQGARAAYAAARKAGKSDSEALHIATLSNNNYGAGVTTGTTTNTVKDPKNYIKYSNQGKTRDKPLSTTLEQSMGFLQDMGITMHVSSGGQDAQGPKRTGSHRHDNGGAGDVDFYKNGKPLKHTNAADRAVISEIITTAVANGVTGVGVAYMGDGRVHIGYGTDAVWSGKGAKAPAWAVEAHKKGVALRGSGYAGNVPQAETDSNSGTANVNIPGVISSDTDTSADDMANHTFLADEMNKTQEIKAPEPRAVYVEPKEETAEAEFIRDSMQKTRALFNSMTDEQIEAHPLLSEDQKVQLRQLTQYKRALADMQDPDTVSGHVLEGHQGATAQQSHLGLKQYAEIFTNAITTNDVDTVNKHLGYLKRFNDNHQAKNEAIQLVLEEGVANAMNPVWVAPTEDGKWIRTEDTGFVSKEREKELKAAGAFKVTGDNKGTRGVQRDAANVATAYEQWFQGTAAIMEGVAPMVAQTRGSRVVNQPAAPVEVAPTTPTDPTVAQATPTGTSTPVVSAPVVTPTPATAPVANAVTDHTAPVDFGNVQRAHSADAIADNPNAVYIGRSGSGKETKSMSQVNAQTGEGIGNPGWLGSTAGRSLGQEADLAEYNHQFKRRFEATPNFAEAVIDLKDKELYVNAHASKGSEAGYVSALLKVLPDDPTEAKAFVRRIESFNPDTGFTLGAEVAPKDTNTNTNQNTTANTSTNPTEQGDAINVTDDTFSFSDTNDFNLSTVNDEKYDENTAAIDEAIKKLKDANRPLTFPTTGVGKALIAAAPRTLAYFNKKVSEEFGIQNGSLLATNKQTPSRANNRTTDLKNRSNVVSTGNTTNRKYSNTAVAEPIQATKVRDERNHGTTETINDYTNTYSGSDSTGAERNVVITRDSKTNKVKSITVENKATGKSHPQNVEDDTYSDELIVTQVANKIAHLKPVFKQAAKQDTVASETEVDGRTLPTELLGKEANLEKTMELHADKIEAGKRDEATKAIYQQLLKPILNINPKMKLKIVEGDGTNAYDKDSNTIVINTKANPDSTIQEEINRLAIESAIKDVIQDMDNPGQIKDAEKLEKLEELTNDVANLMTTVWEAINNPEGAYTKLDPKVQAKINNAMEDAKSLLTTATSDIDVIKFLKEVPITDKRKAKSNVFSRIVKAVTSYFNMGNSKTIDNAFASAVEITARMASEQARDVTVRFDKDIAAKLSVFQMDDTKLAMQAAKQQLVRYYARNQFIATFTQKATLAKPLTSITNFTAKLKLDMMQGIEKFTKTPPTAKQRDQVADFIKFRDDFAIHARNTFVAKEPKYITDKETGEQTLVTDYRYQDLKSYMLDDQGNLSENTITGLALAAYNWAIEFGNKETNEEKDIKKLLNVDPDSTDALPANIREQYMYKGAIKTFTVLELGKSATDVLNIKDNEWASEHTMSRLHASLGEWALSAMQAADLVHIHTMPSDVHKQNAMDAGSESASTYEISDKGVVSFVSITNEQGSDINTRLAEIVHASRGTQDYLGNLFGTEVGLRAPLLEKPSTVKTVIKRTLSVMSSKQQKLVAKMQEEPMAVNVDMLNTLEILLATDRQATLQMIGALVTDEELALEHKDDRASKVSAAQGVLRDLENGLDFTSSLEKLPNGERQQFYDTVYAAKNNRMHYNSNMFNLQSSKLHRSMGEYVNFKTDVDIANEVSSKGVKVYDDKGNVTLTATFLRAIAESAEGTEKIIEAAMAAKGLVVSKGYTVDKVASEFFIEPFYNYLSTDPDVQAAMVGIRKTLKNEKPTTKEVADILKVVQFWEGGPNSLRALTEYTKFADSITNGDAKFTTSLGLGSDGINNGSAISYVQLGDASDLFQTQVGMLPKAGKYGGFNNYLETRFNTKVGDYYTGFAPHVEEAVVGIDPALGAFPNETEANYKKREKEYQVRQKALEVILALNTTYKARKSFKAVLIPFGYSAGMPRLRRLVYAQFLDDIKSTMKKLSAMDTTSEAYATGHAALQYNLNQMLGAKNAVELPHGKELLEFSFNYTQAKTLWNAYDSVMGETTEQALKGYAKSFMALRDHNIGIQQAAEKTYQGLKEIIYNQEMEKYKATVAKKYPDVSDVRKDADTPSALEKMINAEGIPKAYYDKHFKPKLDAVRPGVKTPFNHDEQGDTSATDFRVVKEVSKVTADPASQGVNYKVQDGKYSSTNTMLPMRYSVEESVGVMVNSAQVQGTDGVIAATASALGGQVNLNVHDAAIGGIANHVAMTQMQNKATYEALRDYSAMTSSLLALSNTIRAVAVNRRMGVIDSEMQQYLVTEAVVTAYTKSVIKEQLESSGIHDPSTGEAYSIEDIHENAVYKEFILPLLHSLSEDVIAVEMNKYKILEDMGVMHQYGGEGGQYVITDKDRAGIETAKSKMLDTHTVINENLSMLEKESFIEHEKTSFMPKQTKESSSVESQKDASATTSLTPEEVSNHTGGAYGGDTLWDIVGREFGVNNHNHYREANNPNVSKSLRDRGVKATILTKGQMETARTELENILGKKYPDTIAGNLQVRNYYQVANADSVLAVATLTTNGKGVTGGTNTAVQLGIKLTKPVYVWDVKTESWYTYSVKDSKFEKSDTPHLTKNFAGVGTRDIENYHVQQNGVWGPRPQYVGQAKADKAYQAVKDVYTKSLVKTPTVSVKGLPSDTQGRELVTNAVENMTKPMSVEDFQKITETGYNRTERHLQDLVKSGELSVNSSGKYSKVGAVSTSIDRAEKSKVVSKTDKKEAAGATIEVSKPVSISAVINSLNTLQQKRGMDVQPHRAEAIKYLTKRLTAMQVSDTRELKVQVVDSIPDGASGNYDAARGLLTISANKFNSMNADKQMELLQHEMWHALSVITASQSTNPIVRESYNELEKMRKELLSKFPKDSHMYKHVLQNVEEMIAYGMTDTEVANQIADNLTGKYKAPVDPATGKPVKITTGLLKFVEKVAQFFTGKRSSTKEGYKNYVLFTRLADVMTTPPTAREVAAYQALPVKQVYNSTAKPTDFIKELSATNVSPEQNARLDELIEGPIAQFMEASEQNKVEVLDIADDPNNSAVQAGFKLSDKEVAVMDILKYSAGTFLASEAGTKTAAEIRANYYQVTDQLKREDFLADPANATPQEIRAAQKKLDYIKKMDNVNSVEHLERYVSLILVSPEFQAVADKINNKRKAEQHEGAFNKVMSFFVDLMQKLVGKTMLTTGAKSSDEISILYSRLTKIVDKSAERKANMVENTVMMTGRAVVAPVNYTLSKLTNAIFGSLNLASTMAPNSTLGTAARVAYKVRQNGGILPLIDEAGDYAARLNSYNGKQGLGPLGELLVEMSRNVGMKQTTEELIRMTTKASIDRQTMATSATKKLGELFKDLSSVPNEQLDSVTQVALRADVSSLLNHGVNINRVVKLLTKPNERAKEIQRLEQDIKRRSPNFNDIILQTKTLGVYMSREVAGSHLVKNAEGIAIGQGSWYATDMASMDARLFASIDQLASLYAVDLATDEQKAAFNTLQANDPEAVKGILNHHLEMTKRSKEDLRHNAINYIKGYMPQKTHHLRSLKFAENLTEINKLKAQGWQVIGDEDMGQDKHDNTLERTLMYHKDAHYKDYVSGALDMKDTHAKGTTIYSSSNGTELMRVSKDMLADRRARNQTSYENYNVLKQGESNLIAAYDAEGGLTNYHYEMSGRLRDTYLERNNNSLELLGMLHAKLVSAPQIQDTQRGVATAVYEDFEKSWLADPRKFITLDPRSEDPKIVKMWRMMPYAFQQEAQALFGQGNPIVIRATIFNSVFGYHVYSISEMFDKSTSEKNTFEKLVTTMLDTIFDKKGQLMILRAERAIQSGVAQIKDFIVIRNIKVLVGNIVANSLLLTAQGVPPSQQVKDFVSVWRNGGRYRKLAALVAETDAAIAINRNRPVVLRDLNRKRKQALQEMSQNPLHDFMEKGMMSSIVEDTAVFKEDTGFKSDLENKLEELKDKLPQKVLTAFEWAVTSPGTPLHNFLAHSTQFSDLAAKYSLTRHRMAEGMSSKDAIAEAQDAFINYDVPTGRGLDYMNKMGLFMFTKFLIRFQQVMVKQLEKNAAGVIAQHMAVEHFTNTSGLLDPLLINRIGNPFSAGIFGYGSAFGGITSMNVITGNF